MIKILKEGLTSAAENKIPELKRQAKKRWMTGEILDMIIEQKREEYKEQHD